MAKSPEERQEDTESRDARIARQAAAQRGPVPPEIGETVDDTLDQHPPQEQVARLGTTAAEAEEELQRRQQTDFEGKVIPHRRLKPGMLYIVIILGLLVIGWAIYAVWP